MKPETPDPTDVASPCVGICQINPEGYCIGCFRRLGEIAGWGGLPTSRKQQILDAIAQRRKKTLPEG